MNTKTCSIQMTTGSLWKNILLFSLPLMMTQVLEVLFNLSDVAIAGKFADYIALGAVGSTTLLVSLFTGFLIGMGAGVNVRAAHRLGAGDDEGVRMTVHSSLLVCGIIGVIVCLVCLFLAEPMLTLLRTKSELITEAVTYLRIYSLGMPAMAVYNFGSGILSACGETKRPLIYLSIAGALNVALNLFFVICCGMAASGNSAAANADAIIFNVQAAIHTACASFISRNRGAGNHSRMMKSYAVSLTYSFAAGAILGGLLMLFGRGFLSLFANDAEVINAGMERLYIMGWSYPIAAFMDCTIAAARGIGRTVVPTIMVIMGSCVFRVVWVYTIFAHFQTITSLYLLYSFSWAITAVAEIAYFLPASRKCRFAEDKPALGKSA